MVHPPPTPFSTKRLIRIKNKLKGSNQNLNLFNRGSTISSLTNIDGISHFPKPPINIGMTKKKIIISPWAVIILLKIILSPTSPPGLISSKRIYKLIDVPTKPDQTPIIIYKIAISLWLTEPNQRFQYNLGVFKCNFP